MSAARRMGMVILLSAALSAAAADPASAATIRVAEASAAEIEFWRSVADTTDPAELEAYLFTFPDGQFAPLARLRLDRLKAAEPAAGATAAPPVAAAADTVIPPVPPHEPRGSMGIEIRSLTEEQARELGLAAASGAKIVDVFPGSPAAASGLAVGDAILSLDGTGLRDHGHLSELVGKVAPGRTVELAIVRGGERMTLAVAVGDYVALQWNGAHRGDTASMVRLGHAFNNGTFVAQDRVEATRWFRRGAEAGDRAAMLALGAQYQFGTGVEQDDREAFSWYRQAAGNGGDDGDVRAMAIVGQMYNRGQGVARDLREAARWYVYAAERGDAAAMHNYGVLLQAGDGVMKDEALAVDYFRRAAALGQAESFYTLGDAYQQGRGVAKDLREAVRWYRAGAERGLGHAHAGLGEIYETGGGGLPKSREEAVRHYRIAAESGNEFALYKLRSLKTTPYDPIELQQLLADLGFDPGPIDGKPGRRTVDAIRAFQRDRGLPIDGEASLRLVGQLRDTLKQQTAAAAAPAASTASPVPAGPDFGDLEGLDILD